jgi:hypothetical protein
MMRARRLNVLLVAAAAFSWAAVPALAQTRVDAQSGVEFRNVSFGSGLGINSLKEFAVPVGLAMPIGSRLNVDAGTYYVSAQRTDASGSQTINGLTDVILRGAYQLKPDVAVFTFAVNLPTGHKTLSGDQVAVASAVATDLVPFPVSNFGTGFSVTTGLAWATPVGPWALGIAGSFRYNGAYQPISDTSAGLDTLRFRPGGEVRLRIGADRIVGQGRLSFGVTYSTFANDEFGSQSRSPGTRLIPQFSWSTPLGINNSLVVYGWDVYRNVDENASVNQGVKQNTMALGAMASLRSGARNSLRPQFELRKGWQGPGGLHNAGTLVGLGLRYQMAASERLTLTPGFRVDLGNLTTSSGGSASVTGLSFSLTARTSF